MPPTIQSMQIKEWAQAHSATARRALTSIVLGIIFSSIVPLLDERMVEALFDGMMLDVALTIKGLYFYIYVLALVVVPYVLFVKFGRLGYSLVFSFSAFVVVNNIAVCSLSTYPPPIGTCNNPEPVLTTVSDVAIVIGSPYSNSIVLLIVFLLLGISGYGLQQLKRRATRWWAEARN